MRKLTLSALAAALAGAPPAASAQPLSLQDSFRIGSGSGVLCSAQIASSSKALSDMFDQAYSIVCRDAAVPVGQLFALKDRGGDPAARLARLRADKAVCEAPQQEQIEGLGAVEAATCRMKELDVAYRVYQWRAKDKLYVAEGLGGYDSALRLGLRTIIADRPVDGEISIATTEAGDPAAFARVQAGTLDPQRALAEAYRRNNAGSYAEAAEFFGSLLAGTADEGSQAEALVNQALQQSNLGHYADANALFARARGLVAGDPVMARMFRNYRAMHLLNQQRLRDALAELDRPLPSVAAAAGGEVANLVIDPATAARLNAESPVTRQLTAAGSGLLPEEKVQILEGQAQHLRGTILRLQRQPSQAAAALNTALDRLASVRGGRVTSTVWMRGQLLGELASIAEEQGNDAEAERQHQAATTLIGTYYPGSAALVNTQARLAAFYTRTGRTEPALALYRQIVDANAESGSASPALRRTLAPYFALLAGRASEPGAVADMFKASQVLVRPGVAQTQAVLARELSGGSDEAARLFRQSVTLTRDIERTRIEISRLGALTEPTAADSVRLAELRAQLPVMERDQVATQAKLSEFPRYRVLSGGAMSLAELQKVLRPGEAYYKMTMVGDDGYAIFVTPDAARAYRIGARANELEQQVDALRATISVVENGVPVTYPFDVELSHKLYGALFQPVEAELASVRHLIFEPDGAMLRLPVNLLATERSGVDAYLAKARRPNDDGFDFTDIKWLGRDRDVSTAVSARSFRDVRNVAPSDARNDYIGFGENAPPPGAVRTASTVRGLIDESAGCSWSLDAWGRPISSAELITASQTLGGGSDTEIVTGQAFTDTAIKARDDLSQYRIMHFATHGLVTAPRPECPARPALLTSFGEEGSDGLLTFAEIFDLKLDADLVILSACDTAGKASLAATREAGLTTGGDFALDGLVRAFVGAGGRSVIASHWPVPDDYEATKRLISGLFTAPPGTATATALRNAQIALMRERDTSHPYYWSGFAIIGDGASAVTPKG
ncbi:MAG TPA: CHAT domain-containing protein [Allosphingosinicella sp.]|nr:CHAT domain-containing protein [Allosphingosinicella sp.]